MGSRILRVSALWMPGVYSWVPGIQGAVKPAYEPILYEQVYRKQDYLDWFYGWHLWHPTSAAVCSFIAWKQMSGANNQMNLLVTRASYAFHNIEMKGCPAWYDSWTSGNKIINFCSSHARWIIQTPFFWSTKINLVILFPSFDNLAFNQWWRGWPSSRDVGSLYARLRNYWASHWTLYLNS